MYLYRKMATAGLATLALLVMTVPAMAEVRVGINLGLPLFNVAPPVYYQPEPVYVQPAPVYVQPRQIVVQAPQPVYVQPQPVYYETDYRSHRGHHENGHGYGHERGNRDRDGDGVPNRFDARPDNPYRR